MIGWRESLAMASGELGTAYLLCFEPRYKHAGHYLGWAKHGSGQQRIAWHIRGNSGAKLVEAAVRAGCKIFVGRTWAGVDRDFERKLHNRRDGARMCYRCKQRRRMLRQDQNMELLLARSI